MICKRITHLPAWRTCPSQPRRSEEVGIPSLFDSQDATGNTQEMDTSSSLGSIKRDGSLVAEEQQNRRQLRRTASRTKREGPAARRQWWPSPKQTAWSRRSASTTSCSQPSSRRIRRCESYPRRCGTLCWSRRRAPKQTARRNRGEDTREATRLARERHKANRLSGPDWNPFCRTRFDSASSTYKGDIKRITLKILSPEKRLLVLGALGQTEAERKYGRAPPTGMERELQVFLEDLLKT